MTAANDRIFCFPQKKTQKRKYDEDDLDEDMETDTKSKYKGTS